MKIREKAKKSISEFYSARESTERPITLITNGYRFSIQNESQKIKYFSSTMKRTKEKEQKFVNTDKYKILAGKLHVFKSESDSYLPVLNNNFVDILRLSRRMKNDSNLTRRTSGVSSPTLIDPSIRQISKETKGLKSSQSARTNIVTKSNFTATGQSWLQTTERNIKTSYKFNR